MKVKVKKAVEVKFIKVEAAVRYDEEDMENEFPMRVGDMWKATIEIETGQILAWPGSEAREFHMKVCDEGSYYLLDENMEVVASIEQNYVPNGILPGEYGDYLALKISATGKITNWPKNPSLEDFEEQGED